MGFKKFIVGEPMPDKNDPKFRERYEREVEAGRKFADSLSLSLVLYCYALHIIFSRGLRSITGATARAAMPLSRLTGPCRVIVMIHP